MQNQTILFHGSYTSVKQPLVKKMRYTKDFGVGFYCTNLERQAIRWCFKFDTPTINRYSYTPNVKLKHLKFEEMSEAWLDFIIACRSGQPHDYDIVEGPMADDQIYNFIGEVIKENFSRAAFWELAKFRYPTHQLSFHTDVALTTLTFIDAKEASLV